MTDTTPPAEPNPSAEGEPRQVAKIARQHLVRVGRGGSTTLFRLIMDDPERKGQAEFKPVELVGTFAEHAQALRRANDAGYAVFYQVNQSDGQGYKAGNIVSASCFFADFDGTPLANVDRLGLKPHVEIETSPGKRHYYWRADGIPIDEWTSVQKRLIALFGSDKSIHDKPRIMRLPGFLHMKNPDAPHLVSIVAASDAPPFTYDAFMAALTAAEQAPGVGADKPRKQLPASIAAPENRKAAGDIGRAESALRHLINVKLLDLGDRGEWIRVGIALKASYGENGFGLWLKLSSEADGFEGEDDLRGQWNTFKNDLPPERQLTIASFVAMAKEHGWAPPAGGGGRGEVDHDSAAIGGGVGKPDAASIIVDLADDAGDEHFLSPEGRAHVTYTRKRQDGSTHRVTGRLDSSAYRMVLALRYHEDKGNKAAPREQITAAVGLMEARAWAANVRHPVHLRVAHHNGRVYVNVDPDEGVVVEIDSSPEEWRFVNDPPVRFVVGSRGPLARPERGGTKAMFAAHYNVADDDVTRVIAFMLSAFMPRGPYPILIIDGEAGSAKSNLGDKVVALPDAMRGDHAAGRFTMSTEERNLHIQASHATVIGLDNISSFTAEIADQLCRLSTGAASSFRVHHTMDEEMAFSVARPVVATCISMPTTRTDLLSRALCVTAQRIEHRRTEAAVWRAFNADAGKMLGFLFGCVSAALRNHAAVAARVEAQLLQLPRMADFAEWVEAAGDKLGLKPGDFANLLRQEQAAVQADAVQGDIFVDGFQRHFSQADAKPVSMTARQLLDMLADQDPEAELPAVKAVKGRLQRIAQGLRDSGFDVEVATDKHSKSALFNITTNATFVATPNMPARKPRRSAF